MLGWGRCGKCVRVEEGGGGVRGSVGRGKGKVWRESENMGEV